MNASPTIFCACLLFAGVTLPAQSNDGQPERVLQTLSVGYILAEYRDPRPSMLGSFLVEKYLRFDHSAVSLLEKHASEKMLPIDSLAELVRDLAGQEFTDGRAGIDVTGTTLQLTGDSAAVRRARRITEEIGRIVARPIRIEVALYRSPPDADFPGIADEGELASLTKNLDLIWRGHSITRSGRQVALGTERYTDFVGDIDVDIAQKFAIGYPKMYALFEGLRVVSEPHALSGGNDLVLFCQYAIAHRRREIQTRSTGVKDLPSLDVPLLATASGGMSARIESGQALLLGLGGVPEGGDSMLLTVSARFARDEAKPQSGFALYPVSALASTSLGAKVILYEADVDPRAREGDPVFPFGISDHNSGWMSYDELQNLVVELLGDRVDQGETAVARLGGFLMVHGQEDDRERIRAFLGHQEDQRFHTERVRIETKRFPLEASSSRFPASPEDAEPGEFLHALSFPALVGRPHLAMRGLETMGIADYLVAIAQEAGQANPVVGRVFSGLLCTVTAERSPDGLAAKLQMRLIDAGEVRRRALEADYGGDLYLHSPTLADFQHDGPLPESGVLSLGDGPIIRTQTQNWQTTQSIQIGGR